MPFWSKNKIPSSSVGTSATGIGTGTGTSATGITIPGIDFYDKGYINSNTKSEMTRQEGNLYLYL